jgi:Zn-dependent metalloprotease
MAKIKDLDANVEINEGFQVPRRIFDIKPSDALKARVGIAPGTVAKTGSAQLIAENFLKSIEGELDISVDPANLRFDKVLRSPLGRHVLFQQYIDGKPVSNGWVRVDLDNVDNVYNVQNDTVPSKAVPQRAKSAPAASLQPDQAIQAAFGATDCASSKTREVLSTELVFFPTGKTVQLAWKVVLRATEPPKEWKVYVNAEDGKILDRIRLLKEATGKATLFDPNPVVTLDDSSLQEGSQIPTNAYVKVDLLDLSGTGFLDGKYVTTKRTTNRIQRANNDFSAKREQLGFKEAMIYFHIDRVQRFIQELGFENVLNGPIEVDADGTPQDNSFYSPTTKALTFGTGGVDDAEDADIILHEYGHAIQDAQVPGWGQSSESGSMGEAFGDYLAGSFFEGKKAARLKACVGTWDAVAYSDDDPPCLRRLDSKKHYPEDVRGEVHEDGEMWSAFLWQVHQSINNRDVAMRLVLGHHFLLTKTASFRDAVNAMVTADNQLNGGLHVVTIRQHAQARGFLP